MTNDRCVLVVSDYADSGLLLQTLFKARLGCEATVTDDPIEALKLALRKDFQAVILDIENPVDEIFFAKKLTEKGCSLPIIIYSNEPPHFYAQKQLGLFAEFVRKHESRNLICVLAGAFGWEIKEGRPEAKK